MMFRCVIVVLLLLAAAAARTALDSPPAVTTAEPLSRFPAVIDAWTGEDSPLAADVVKTAAVDDYLNRAYRSNASGLGLYVGYYQSQRQGESLHSPLQCLPGAGWQPIESGPLELRVPSTGTRTIRKLVVKRGVDQLLVLYWYQTVKRVTGSEYLRKLFLVADAFDSGRTDVALVRIIAPIGVRDNASEIQALALARPFAERVLPEVQKRLFRE
jgi:EpsI family protein